MWERCVCPSAARPLPPAAPLRSRALLFAPPRRGLSPGCRNRRQCWCTGARPRLCTPRPGGRVPSRAVGRVPPSRAVSRVPSRAVPLPGLSAVSLPGQCPFPGRVPSRAAGVRGSGAGAAPQHPSVYEWLRHEHPWAADTAIGTPRVRPCDTAVHGARRARPAIRVFHSCFSEGIVRVKAVAANSTGFPK